MVRQLLALFFACSCFGQSYTLMDQAFLGKLHQPIYGGNLITNGLTAYWKLNEGTGTNSVDYWNGLTTTNYLTSWIRQSPIPFGWSLTQSYSGYIASTPTNRFDLLGTNWWTVCMWLYPTAPVDGDVIFANSGNDFYINYNSAYPRWQIWMRYSNGLNMFGSLPGSALPVNQWTFLCITRSNRVFNSIPVCVSTYTNGSICSSSVQNSQVYPPTSRTTFMLGNATQADKNFGGYIGETLVYTGTNLLDSQIDYLYHTYYRKP